MDAKGAGSRRGRAGSRREPDDEVVDDRPAGLIGAVDNVLRLLRLFETNKVIRVNEVSRDMGLSRSTVHRMLSTLSYHQFVEQDDLSRAYRPGPALVDIGLAVVQNMDLRAVCHSALVELSDVTKETVHVAVLRGAEVLYLDAVESDQIVRTGSRIGLTLPAHATAAGKSILAELSERELKRLLPRETLPTPTKTALSSRAALMKQLAEIRERGFAINNAESEVDVSGVGAAIRDRNGRVRGALVVTAPKSRVDDAWVARVGAATMQAVAELTDRVS